MSQWQLNIIRFENGMVAVTDDKGEQIPRIQGKAELSIPRICRWLRRKEHKALKIELEYWMYGFSGMLMTLAAVFTAGMGNSMLSVVMSIGSGMYWMIHLQAMLDLHGVK